jgi:Radical SAM superfamily
VDSCGSPNGCGATPLSDQPFPGTRYPGRSALIRPEGLRELWVQLNDNCNLAYGHCLVGSGPGKETGLPLGRLKTIVDQAVELGIERLYLTGGEPFVRRDIFSLLKHATEGRGLEVIVLTNGTAWSGCGWWGARLACRWSGSRAARSVVLPVEWATHAAR